MFDRSNTRDKYAASPATESCLTQKATTIGSLPWNQMIIGPYKTQGKSKGRFFSRTSGWDSHTNNRMSLARLEGRCGDPFDALRLQIIEQVCSGRLDW